MTNSGLGLILTFGLQMETLPGDILGEIFEHFDDLRDTIHLARACKGFWAKYVEIRAKPPKLYIRRANHFTPRIKIYIHVKNYVLAIVFTYLHGRDYGDLDEVNHAPYKYEAWNCLASDFTADYYLERDKKVLFYIEHSPQIKEFKIIRNIHSMGNFIDDVYCDLKNRVSNYQQIDKYLYIYDTFLKYANVDNKYKESFKALPNVMHVY